MPYPDFDPAPRPRPASSPMVPLLLFGILLALLWRLIPWPRSLRDPNAAPREITARGDLANFERTSIEIFEQNRPSVVHITTKEWRRTRGLFGSQTVEVEAGSGSGFVWSEDGSIVTNFHVLEDASRCFVQLPGEEFVEGELVGGDPDFDLAVVKIDPSGRNLRPVKVGTSADLRVGQAVYAIGNPFGLDWTLTTGVVSGLDRVITSVRRTPIDGVIQTDAAINPGNSGGPLLDSAGRLIGINTAIYSPSGASAGIGFAVPVDRINEVVPNILRRGTTLRPGLGIVMVEDERTRAAGIEGVIARSVLEGSAADRAGLLPLREVGRGEVGFDVIVGIDDAAVRSREDLVRILEKRAVGDEVTLHVLRDGRSKMELKATLQGIR